MNILVAAAGVDPSVVGRLRDLVEQAGTGRTHELTDPGGPVVLLVRDDDGGVVGRAGDGPRQLAALGSGLRAVDAAGGAPADRLLRDAAGAGLLDGAPHDLVAVAVGPEPGRLVAAAGRANQRLFVHEPPGGGLVVSSHLATLVRAVGAPVDRSYEDFLLGYGFLPDGRTSFAGIRALAPGERIDWRGRAEVQAVAATAPAVATPATHDDAVAAVSGAFHDAVARQAGTDTRHAVLLGGVDSALVAATLRRLGHEVHTFTFRFGDPTYEQRNVDLATSTLGTVHHDVHLTPSVVMDGLEALPETLNQPGLLPHYQLHTVIASRAIREQGFTHAFSGDGCDAVFLGYPTVSRRARLTAQLGRLPGPVVTAGLRGLSVPFVEDHLGQVARMGRSTLGSLTYDYPARGHLPSRCLDDAALDRLRRDHPPQAESVRAVRLRLAAGLEGLDPVRLAFHGNGLNGQSRAKVEGAVMATGVAQSSPFLDPRLRALVASLPTELLRPEGTRAGAPGKAILFEMIRRERLLVDELVDQPKQSPADSPIDQWYAGPLRPRVLALLQGLPFEWDERYVDALLRPTWAEEGYRRYVSIGHHALTAVGALASYAAFARLASA